jgi:hypothetical protein
LYVLEDDALITSLKIETVRNLSPPQAAVPDHVKLDIMVKIEPAVRLHVNKAFQGD